jgi:hypothetical protein
MNDDNKDMRSIPEVTSAITPAANKYSQYI